MKAGRNDPCPCGSGKKFKKCCLASKTHEMANHVGFSQQDRLLAQERLSDFLGTRYAGLDDEAYDEFYQWFTEEQLETLDQEMLEASEAVYDMWVFFDRPLVEGRCAVDLLLAKDKNISAAEREYLQLLKNTSLKIYEVEDLLPGVSMTLRDVIDDFRVTVSERTASRSLARHSCIIARITPCGVSGKPEIESGCLSVPALLQTQWIGAVRENMDELRRKFPDSSRSEHDAIITPFLHGLWLKSLVDPVIPRLTNTEGEVLLWTRIHFDVTDEAGLRASLKNLDGIEQSESHASEWHWCGKNLQDQTVGLGSLVLKASSLLLEASSRERAAKLRALLEESAGMAIRHRSTTHEDIAAGVQRDIKQPATDDTGDSSADQAIPREIIEELTMDYLAKYYRQWLDDPIPALNGQTPRTAVSSATLRPEVVKLLNDLERMYEQALKNSEPAYDPSWMRDELGLSESTGPAETPPIAHERLTQGLTGFGKLCKELAEQTKKLPGFKADETILVEETIRTSLAAQRFLRQHNQAEDEPQPAEADAAPACSQETLAAIRPLICDVVNYHLYLRKTFLVDPGLAYLLSQTHAEIPGEDLRVPFKAFALVFTDRHALSLMERWLSVSRTSPLAGYILRILTVYITEYFTGANRVIRIAWVADTLGADLPHPIIMEVAVSGDDWLSQVIEKVIEESGKKYGETAARLSGKLLELVFNTILYATSADVKIEQGTAPQRARKTGLGSGSEQSFFSGGDVYYLPGTIDISQVRQLQALEKTTSGKKFLHRFMTRGHWRRPNPSWTDQRLRWISPYWKGPDLASVIERTYRLKP